MGHLLASLVTPASTLEHDQVAALAHVVQRVTGHTVEVAYLDQGYTGLVAAHAAATAHITLEVVA